MCPALRNDDPTSVIARSAAVLSTFGPDDHALGVAELARRSGLPKSTVHRLTTELVRAGLLERDGVRLRLGLRLFELGELVPRRRGLRTAALPFMEDLREATRGTIHLAVLEGSEVVYLEILPGPDGPPVPSRVGGRLPAHATAVGKAMLAYLPAGRTEQILRGPLRPLTARTLTAPGAIRRQLARIRDGGVAYDREESGPGVVCAASPIRGADGTALAALSVCGRSGRTKLDRTALAVHTTALALTRRL